MRSFALIRNSLMLLLFTSFLFTSCETEDSSDVNQDKIYADYELFYNSNTDKTQVIARFRFGNPTGTLLELTDPASVKFDGENLPFKPLYSGHFKEFSGKLEAGTFLYTNVDGTTFENILPSYESIAFPESLDTISKTNAYTLEWEGDALKEDQNVGLFIGSWVWGQDALFIQSEQGSNSIVMGTDQLANVQAGQTTFYMDRATEKDVEEGTSEGGKIRAKFRALNKNVIVKE